MAQQRLSRKQKHILELLVYLDSLRARTIKGELPTNREDGKAIAWALQKGLHSKKNIPATKTLLYKRISKKQTKEIWTSAISNNLDISLLISMIGARSKQKSIYRSLQNLIKKELVYKNSDGIIQISPLGLEKLRILNVDKKTK